jgi:hypothetical protein
MPLRLRDFRDPDPVLIKFWPQECDISSILIFCY